MALPHGLDEVRARPLPPDMLALLKAAAGDAKTLAAEAGRYRSEAGIVQEACATFAQQVLLLEGNDPFRVLGCAAEADDEQLRQHFRWLQRWLHPDRDPDGWVSVFADRVNAAWDVLKRPEARVRARAEAELRSSGHASSALHRRPVFHERPFALSPDERRPWWQFLPHAVVGGSLLLAAAVYWADRRFEGLKPPPFAADVAAPGPSPLAAPPPALAPPEVAATSAPAPAPPEVAATSVPAPAPVGGVASPAPLPVLPVARAATASPPSESLPTAVVPGVPPVTVLLAFRGAYQRGDATGLMRLFTADARTASGDWVQTRDDYAALFAATKARELSLHDIVWRPDGEGWVGEGRLAVRLKKHQGGFRQHHEGPFTVRLQPRAGTHRIVSWEQGGHD